MKDVLQSVRKSLPVGLIGMLVLCVAVSATAKPPASRAAGTSEVHSQLQKVDAQIAAARTQQTALQSQVAQMEKQNSASREQLKQRDAEIAALRQKLQAAGLPVSAGSAGH